MTGKVFESDGPNFSLLIIPVAVGIILIAMAWPLLVLLIAAVIAWKVYDKIQWLRQCDSLNPLFNQLIKENKGCLTVLDFSNKTSLNNRLAKGFLERKAQEYGAVRKNIGNQGIVYYFITASALGSIFDESEATDETEKDSLESTKELPSAANVLAELAQLKKSQPQTPTVETVEPIIEEVIEVTSSAGESEVEITPTISTAQPEIEAEEGSLKLIQSELAKRLDINSSTIGKRKLESDFTEWSQSKDPEGIAWVYVHETKVFIPKTS